jgi:hypothetical protein
MFHCQGFEERANVHSMKIQVVNRVALYSVTERQGIEVSLSASSLRTRAVPKVRGKSVHFLPGWTKTGHPPMSWILFMSKLLRHYTLVKRQRATTHFLRSSFFTRMNAHRVEKIVPLGECPNHNDGHVPR